MYLFCNGRLITHDGQAPFFEDGAVAVDKEQIIDVGTGSELIKKYSKAEKIDANGNVIMPGLINLFSYSTSIFTRGLRAKLGCRSTIIDQRSRCRPKLEQYLTLESILAAAYACALESLKNGVTTVFEHIDSPKCISGSLQTAASAFRTVGIRSCICSNVDENAPWRHQKEALDESFDFYEYCSALANSLIHPAFGISISDGANGDNLSIYRELNAGRMAFHIKVDNSGFIRENSMRLYRMSPWMRLAKAGLMTEKTIAAFNCLEPEEFESAKKSNACIIPLLLSDLSDLNIKASDDAALRQLGIGTGEYGFDVLETARIIRRYLKVDPSSNGSRFLAQELLFNANADIASSIFGLPLGVIKPGAAADVVVMKFDSFTPFDANNAEDQIANWCCGKQCETLMAAGKLLMKNGEVLNCDEKSIKLRVLDASEALWRSL